MLGLCSGSYYVDPEVRPAGLFLFRRYLASPGYSFFFATTCNLNSGTILKRHGATAVPCSQTDYVLPLRFDVMLPELLARKPWSRMTRELARRLGRCGNMVSRLAARRSVSLMIEPSRDWEKLSALSYQHRADNVITADRSVDFLRWRYGPSSPNRSSDICLFRDESGNEGWFALGWCMLGRRGQIRASLVLDVVWPRGQIDFGDIVHAMVQRIATTADMIRFPSRSMLDYREFSRWIVARTLQAPRVWAVAATDCLSLDLSSLDCVLADGDSGWTTQFEEPALASGSGTQEHRYPAPQRVRGR